jgi:hypothetical protein
MAARMTKALVSQSLFRAVSAKRPEAGLVHHSDRGSQYCAHEFRRLLHQFKMRASMSGKGNCFDNAPMESFWGTLKTELVFHRKYATRQEATQDITEYIEIFITVKGDKKSLAILHQQSLNVDFMNRNNFLLNLVSIIDDRPQPAVRLIFRSKLLLITSRGSVMQETRIKSI